MARLMSKQYKNAEFEDFDPNNPDVNGGVWGIFSYGKRFRVYTSRAILMNSAHASHRCKLYRLTELGWILLTVKDHTRVTLDTPCDRCGGPTDIDSTGRRGAYRNGYWVFDRAPGATKASDPLTFRYVCARCR